MNPDASPQKQETSVRSEIPGTQDKAERPDMPQPTEAETISFKGDNCSEEPFHMREREHIAAIRNMEVRSDDVFVCAFPKAGTHWTWELVTMLLKGKAEYEPRTKIAMMMDFMPIEEIAAMPSPRVFNTHFPFRFLPYQIREKGAKIVYITRNPKDVAVSFYHHSLNAVQHRRFYGTFAEFLTGKILFPSVPPDWFEYVLEWEKVQDVLPDLKVISMAYEDMKEDLCSHVARLSEFLGTGASKELCQQIAEACSFDSLKEAYKSKAFPTALPMAQRTQDLLGTFRKGQVGDWKNWFTVAQNEMFDKVYEEKMKGSKLTFRYTL